MRAHTSWRHSLVVPGESAHARARRHLDGRGRSRARRIQLSPAVEPACAGRAPSTALEPDLIEVGDAFHPAWAAASVAEPPRHSAHRVLSFEFSAARRAGGSGSAVQKFIEWYVRLTYERCAAGARAQPLHVRLPAQHRRQARHLSAAGRGRRHVRSRAAQRAICAPSSTCRAARACWCSPGASPPEKNIPVLHRRRSAGSAIPITCC